MGIKRYSDLRVWHCGMALAEAVYKASARFPRSELFGLRAQIQRCAISIPSNIAEGHARGTTREFLRFLSIALGSTAELETQLQLASRLGYVDQSALDDLQQQAGEIGRMLQGLRASLQRRLRRPTDQQGLLSLVPSP